MFATLNLPVKKINMPKVLLLELIPKIRKTNRLLCRHFGVRGGCKWQNLDYQWQLFYKQKQVEDALKRIAKVPYPGRPSIIASEKTTFYRNKLEFTFSNKKWLSKDDFNKALENKNAEEESNYNAFTDAAGQSNAVGFHIPWTF